MVEKSQKTVTKIPAVARVPATDGKRLHAFTALSPQSLTVLGPRRNPAVKCASGNNDAFINIFTSNGFQALTNTEYIAALDTLKPDIAISLADMDYTTSSKTTTSKSHAKGIHRMCNRTEDWLAGLQRALDSSKLQTSGTALFAPTLPAPLSIQWAYLSRLAEEDELRGALSGLAVYDVDLLPDIDQRYPTLTSLPRLSLDNPSSPHEILRQIGLGADLFLLPMLNAVSDAGVAMAFTFPPPADTTELLSLGTDLTDPANTTSLAPLHDYCSCYTCTTHHRAYLHHLLNAREMLAWTLLQIHNHHMLTTFFTNIRASISNGTFEVDCKAFHRAYEAELPAGLGTRPRARGYHFKSEGPNEERRNKVTWQLLQEGQGEKAEVVEEKLESAAMESPLRPGKGVEAGELVREGMGEVESGSAS